MAQPAPLIPDRAEFVEAVEAGGVAAMEVLARDLKVMDASAVALCRDNNIPIVVFNIREQGNLARVLSGEGTATIVQNGE